MFEEPRPSAGLVVARVLGFVAAYFVGWTGVAMTEPAAGTISFVIACCSRPGATGEARLYRLRP